MIVSFELKSRTEKKGKGKGQAAIVTSIIAPEAKKKDKSLYIKGFEERQKPGEQIIIE